MNEEQADKLIDVLIDIRELMKPKQEIKIIEKIIRPASVEKLMKFKDEITSDEFFSTLNKEQQQFVLKITRRPNE